MNLARYMQHVDRNGVVSYKYAPPADAVEAGVVKRKKISHWLIINRIRWETSIMTTGNEFKISNDYIAFYARHWRETYPLYKDLFNVKRMIGETL